MRTKDYKRAIEVFELIDFNEAKNQIHVKSLHKMRYPGLWKVKGFLTITAFERTVGSKTKPLPEVKSYTGNHIDSVSFPTFKLKNFSYTNSDLGSLLTMYNPSMTSNISKVSKDKLDNAKVTFNRLDVNLNGFYGQ